jgi:hypothetical protein
MCSHSRRTVPWKIKHFVSYLFCFIFLIYKIYMYWLLLHFFFFVNFNNNKRRDKRWNIYKWPRLTLATHWSVEFDEADAKKRRKVAPESDTISSFRRLLSESSSSSSISCSLLHGCHDAPTLSDTHIFDIGPCPTVRSNEINPNSISSALNKKPRKKKS